MANSIIDSKTDERKFGGLINEHITTTLNLVQTGNDQFGITYQISFTGRKNGSSSGGPQSVTGNTSFQANSDPLVMVVVSGYTDTGTTISMHVNIQVTIPIVGNKTIFDQTLSGPYSNTSNLTAMVSRIAEILERG